MSITIDGRGVRWDWWVPVDETRTATLTTTDAVSTVVAEVFASGVKVADMAVSSLPSTSFTVTTPEDLGTGPYTWAVSVDGVQWATGNLRVVRPGDPRVSPQMLEQSFVVGEDVTVEVTVVGATVPINVAEFSDGDVLTWSAALGRIVPKPIDEFLTYGEGA